MTFGERLVEAREQLGLNQRQLAEILEITPTRLNYWEKDKRQPDVPMIKALARALQVSADYLIGNDPITNIKKAPSLSDEAMKLAKDYDINLDDWGQKAVRGLADTEIARCEAERLRQLTQQDAEFAADLAPRTKIIPLLGNSFAADSSIWAAADSWQKCGDIQVLEESGEKVSVRFTYTAPVLPGLPTDVTYTVEDTGSLTMTVHYHGGPNRPGLPLLGLRFETPEPMERVEWLGLSGETYPDRKRGGVFGWHRERPHIPPYLAPQECGCHVDARALLLRAPDGGRLALEMVDSPFAFSALPYTPQQLEQAAHVEELPVPVRTVVTLCGAMRGVGGIDSWGSDVEEAFRLSGAEDREFTLRLII